MGVAKGQGTLLQVSISSVFTTIAERTKVKPPPMERGKIVRTNLDSTWQQSVAGLPDGGEVELTCHYDPAATTHAYLWTSFQAGSDEAWKAILTDSGAAEVAFTGWIKKFEPGEAVTDNLVELAITICVTGAVTITP